MLRETERLGVVAETQCPEMDSVVMEPQVLSMLNTLACEPHLQYDQPTCQRWRRGAWGVVLRAGLLGDGVAAAL